MLAFAAHLAWLLPARDEAAEHVEEYELVAAGGVRGAEPGPATSAAAYRPGDGELPSRARSAGGIASSLTILGTLLLTASTVMRGLEVHRMPLGNMFEFALTGSTFVMLAYVGWSLRRNLRWLGLFVTGPAVLVLGLAITIWYVDGAELMPSLRVIGSSST